MRRSEELAIEERLRRALDAPLEEQRDERVDMTPAAITARIRDLCEMSSLCLDLAMARSAAGL